MSIFHTIRRLFIGGPGLRREITTAKVRNTLEPVEFPDPANLVVPPTDLVVDFGTTATVVALVQDGFPNMQGQQGGVAVDLLVGRTEHRSELTISNGKVIAVGNDAYTDAKQNPGHVFYSSLKRYLEVHARAGIPLEFPDVVSEYLVKSLESSYRTLTLENRPGFRSRIVVSVPNSFNPKAVGYIRSGIIGALNTLNAKGDQLAAEDKLSSENVMIVRESEAVAYLYFAKKLVGSAPKATGQDGPFEWIPKPAAATINKGLDRRIYKIIVLDVGGGTTDLSLVEVNENPDSVKVLLNAGIPMGGTDVDKLILRSAIPLKSTLTGKAARYEDALRDVREKKDSRAAEVFESPASGTPDELSTDLESLFDKDPALPPNERIPLTEPGIDQFRLDARDRLEKLIQFSVNGLFGLIPLDARSGATTILLTGRASLLPEIREAVSQQAGTMGANLLTLDDQYHLKLAVAYGCALLRDTQVSRSVTPSGTLGRALIAWPTAGGSPLARFDCDFPISGSAPTVWRFQFSQSSGAPSNCSLAEYRVDAAGINDVPLNKMTALGCGRVTVQWPLREHPQLVLLHPDNDAFYGAQLLPPERHWHWSAPIPPNFALRDINFVTGFPVGFPHV